MTVALLANSALPCCTAYGKHPISLVDEKVIIVWNPDRKLQHFVRQASFEGDATDFGFIVPTPSDPEVAVADAKAFDRMEALVPRDAVDAPASDFASGGPPAGGVSVIRETRVGDYMAAILQATDGSSMVAWLKENGYQSRPAMEEWLEHYAKQNWYFAALKFVRKPDSVEEKTSALRISFKTDVPHYPYKMPTDTWPSGHVRPLALYFIGPEVAKAVYRGSSDGWEAEKVWAGALPDRTRVALAKDIDISPKDIPAGAAVTVLVNWRNKYGYDRDLDFVGMGTLSGGIPIWSIWVTLLIVIVLIAIFRKRREVALPDWAK